jgi:hypothetical protein
MMTWRVDISLQDIGISKMIDILKEVSIKNEEE